MKNRLMTIVFSLVMLTAFGQASDDYSQTIRKEFNTTAETTLEITNQFGKVKCENWNKPMVGVVVTITAKTDNKEKADKILAAISVQMEQKNNAIALVTKIGDMPSRNKGDNFNIDFVVSLPETMALSIDNEFGDVVCDRRKGDFELELSYGAYQLQALDGQRNKLEISFSKGVINSASNAEITLSYSGLQMESVGTVKLHSEFSELSLTQCNALDLQSAYDKLNFEKIGSFKGETAFSTVKLGEITADLTAEFEYGAVSIRKLASTLGFFDARFEFSSLKIEDVGAIRFKTLAVDIEHGNFNYPSGLNVKVEKQGYTEVKYRAEDAAGTAKFKVTATNSNISMR
ncbi:MAG: hypothetical protein KGZ82_04000 [Bacteroidales bacterium]|nr:hypothetical protein [Bacteroidales bacterium]